MVKRLLTFTALLGGAFTLSGCELNNESMEDIISKCKEDTECKAIIDREIDEALEERGIYPNYYDDDFFYDDDFYWELTEEEQAKYDAIELLDEEYFTKIENMTEEEVTALYEKEIEGIIGRELTAEEITAYELIDALYNQMDETEYPDFETETEYIEFYLGRALTDQEKASLTTVENLWESLEEVEVDEDYDFDFDEDLSEQDLLAELLGRELTEDEINAITSVESLYEELEDNYFEKDFELMLGRELTEEEKAAFLLVEAVEEEIYENYEDFTFENVIQDYENVLGRELTDVEKAAIEYFYSVDFMYDDEFIDEGDFE